MNLIWFRQKVDVSTGISSCVLRRGWSGRARAPSPVLWQRCHKACMLQGLVSMSQWKTSHPTIRDIKSPTDIWSWWCSKSPKRDINPNPCVVSIHSSPFIYHFILASSITAQHQRNPPPVGWRFPWQSAQPVVPPSACAGSQWLGFHILP